MTYTESNGLEAHEPHVYDDYDGPSLECKVSDCMASAYTWWEEHKPLLTERLAAAMKARADDFYLAGADAGFPFLDVAADLMEDIS